MRRHFSADGPLARHVSGYAPRAAQVEMAQAASDALREGRTLVVEAGTGTGKTFAYLVAALASGCRVVISTGTLTLQDQLFYRDLPRIRAALGAPVRVTLLKGRANYLCRYRLNQALQQPAGARDLPVLQELGAWMNQTDSGELQEMRTLPEDHPLLPRVTSTAENCLGSKCPDFDACFVVRARRNAQAADVVVVNHHLLFADFLVKQEGFGEVLPGADAVIVDEAHQLPELATRFFGVRVSTRQLNDLAQDTLEEADALGDVPELKQNAAELGQASAALEPCFAALSGRERLEAFLRRPQVEGALKQIASALAQLAPALEVLAERAQGIRTCAERAAALRARIDAMLSNATDGHVRWVEAAGRGGALHSTPVRIDGDFGQLRGAYDGAWILTSATLATGDDFSHFCGQLGLDDARLLRLESPFDYARQARLYLPPGMPEPNTAGYTEQVVNAVRPVIEASGGGVFVLCTSHRALREVARRLREELELPMWVQGEGARTELLNGFTRAGNGVLVGTASFWEGVDVRGHALRVVAIDRLPFAAPGDPVFDARLAAIREAGGDPFNDYQLPQAIMTLRQGVGRLIRDPEDRGLLVLCDPRLRTRPYGRRMLASLPPIPRVDTLEAAQEWIRSVPAPAPDVQAGAA